MNAREFDHVVGSFWADLLSIVRRDHSLELGEELSFCATVSGGEVTVCVKVDSDRYFGEHSRRLSAPTVVRSDRDTVLLGRELLGLPDLTDRERNAFVLLASSEHTRCEVAVRTVGQLVELGRDDLLRMRGVGEGTVALVEGVLARLGLWLGAHVVEGATGRGGGGI